MSVFFKNDYDEQKIQKCETCNKKLGLNDIETRFRHNNVIFVYSVPKVGSTSIVSSLRLFCFFGYVIIHIHDEIMFQVLTNINTNDISIVDIINYNLSYLKRNVVVIDIYRNPIEHKISTYFEKLGCIHFNIQDDKVDKLLKTETIIQRFNRIFPYLCNEDIFYDKFELKEDIQFNFENKYLLYKKNNLRILKLRLMDSKDWASILNKVLGINIVILKDHTTTNKKYKNTYTQFKKNYRIPENFLSIVSNDKYFTYYLSLKERQEYLNEWEQKKTNEFLQIMTENEYKLYMEISLENQQYSFIDTTHYLYNGCTCKGCLFKRQNVIKELMKIKNSGINNINEIDYSRFQIKHDEANKELAKQKFNSVIKRLK